MKYYLKYLVLCTVIVYCIPMMSVYAQFTDLQVNIELSDRLLNKYDSQKLSKIVVHVTIDNNSYAIPYGKKYYIKNINDFFGEVQCEIDERLKSDLLVNDAVLSGTGRRETLVIKVGLSHKIKCLLTSNSYTGNANSVRVVATPYGWEGKMVTVPAVKGKIFSISGLQNRPYVINIAGNGLKSDQPMIIDLPESSKIYKLNSIKSFTREGDVQINVEHDKKVQDNGRIHITLQPLDGSDYIHSIENQTRKKFPQSSYILNVSSKGYVTHTELVTLSKKLIKNIKLKSLDHKTILVQVEDQSRQGYNYKVLGSVLYDKEYYLLKIKEGNTFNAQVVITQSEYMYVFPTYQPSIRIALVPEKHRYDLKLPFAKEYRMQYTFSDDVKKWYKKYKKNNGIMRGTLLRKIDDRYQVAVREADTLIIKMVEGERYYYALTNGFREYYIAGEIVMKNGVAKIDIDIEELLNNVYIFYSDTYTFNIKREEQANIKPQE